MKHPTDIAERIMQAIESMQRKHAKREMIVDFLRQAIEYDRHAHAKHVETKRHK